MDVTNRYFFSFQIPSALSNESEKHKSLTSHQVVRSKKSYRTNKRVIDKSAFNKIVSRRSTNKQHFSIRNAPRRSLDSKSTSIKNEQKRGEALSLLNPFGPDYLHRMRFKNRTVRDSECPDVIPQIPNANILSASTPCKRGEFVIYMCHRGFAMANGAALKRVPCCTNPERLSCGESGSFTI